jgi:exodeoxyribonuclease VII large subunit
MTSTKQITLSQLLGAVEQTFEEIFSGHIFTVIAETGDIKNYPDRQYCFFSLIEKQNGETLAKADAVIWRSHYHIISKFERSTGKRFEKNMQVLLHIEVTYHAVFGMRLRVVDIDEKYTLGQIEQERQRVLEKLVTLNPQTVQISQGEYFTANKKKQIPEVIKRIALITAPDSDGLRDFMHELESNAYGYTFLVAQFLTRIQGKGAELDIAAALVQVQKSSKKYDLVVLIRGGGSGHDLGPFDCYEPSQLIAGFPIPVVTGIGHERNISVADLMSHTRVKTPTKAASFIVEHNCAFEENIIGISEEILETAGRHLQRLNMQLEKISSGIFPSARHALLIQDNKLVRFEQHAKANDPQRILSRGYSLIRKNGILVTHSDQISEGDQIQLQMAEGNAEAKITSKS